MKHTILLITAIILATAIVSAGCSGNTTEYCNQFNGKTINNYEQCSNASVCSWQGVSHENETWCYADANKDGKVDGGDLAIYQIEYCPLGNCSSLQADFNNDGKVDGGDMAIYQVEYDPLGTTCAEISTFNCEPIITCEELNKENCSNCCNWIEPIVTPTPEEHHSGGGTFVTQVKPKVVEPNVTTNETEVFLGEQEIIQEEQESHLLFWFVTIIVIVTIIVVIGIYLLLRNRE